MKNLNGTQIALLFGASSLTAALTVGLTARALEKKFYPSQPRTSKDESTLYKF